MNVWILQDQPGTNMANRLKVDGKGTRWIWNVERYVSDATEPHVERGDIVLQWQPHLDNSAPAGIYAVARVTRGPYHSPNPKTNWQVEVQISQVLPAPVTRDAIKATQNPILLDMQIMRMPGGHIVFRVTPEQWRILQQLSSTRRTT